MNLSTVDACFNLLLVDDHTIVREGLRHILEPLSSQWRITEASTGFEALGLLNRQHFDLAIVDLSMPGMSGLELIRRIKAGYPSVQVLVLSMHADEQYALRAFKSGANGYLTKDSAATELINAVNKVATGGAYVSSHLAERVVKQLNGGEQRPSHADLSDRELEVLRRLVCGQRPTDIAKELHLSIKTVSTHKSHILEKLNLSSMAGIIRYGLEHQLDKGEFSLAKDSH